MDVLVGHTGLVGSTLLRQRPFDLCVHRANLHMLHGVHAQHLFLSALPAEKWRINADPPADLANMALLQQALGGVQAQTVVLISTVDVYAVPVDVDEFSAVGTPSPYGAHRHAFERWVREHFPRVLVLRLPGLFGAGLKKNALFDLLHNNQVERLHPQAQLQWYPLQRLSPDIDLALAHGLDLVNLSVEPVTTGEIATRIFGRAPLALPAGLGAGLQEGLQAGSQAMTPARYSMRSLHAQTFGGGHGWCVEREQLWPALTNWHAQETAGRGAQT